jgi:hypothetical protein
MIGLLGVGIVALAGIALSRHADAPVPIVTADAAHTTVQLDADGRASVPELQDRIRRLEERIEGAEERPPYRPSAVATDLDELRDEVSALKRHLGLMPPSSAGAIDSRAPALDTSAEPAGVEVARRQPRGSRAAPPPATGPAVRPSGVVAENRSPVTSKPGSTSSAPRVKAPALSTPRPGDPTTAAQVKASAPSTASLDSPTTAAQVKASAPSTASLADPAASIATPVPPAAMVHQTPAPPRPVTVLARPDPAPDVEASRPSVVPSPQTAPPASRTIRDDWKVLKRSARSGAEGVTEVFRGVRAWLTRD